MQPNNFLPETSGRTSLLVDGVLDAEACARVIALAEARGFAPTGAAYPASYRDNDRLVIDDAALAADLFARLSTALPPRLEADGEAWSLSGLNTRFRFCRYRDGQGFCVHRDGAHAPGPDERSRLTCQVYLNDGSGFEGGSTRFYQARDDASPVCAVTPRAGAAIVFDHDLWHDGEPVHAGTKYVMRTDVIYRRTARPPIDARRDELRGHLGYVWSVIALAGHDGGDPQTPGPAGGSLASASRDRTIRLWERGPDGFFCARVLHGHASSVTSLVEPSPDRLWSGARDGSILAWDRASGASRAIGSHDGAVLCLAPLEGGGAASGSADRTVGLWSPEGARTGTLAGHDGWVWSVVDLGGGLAVTGAEDGMIRLFHRGEQRCLHALAPGHGPANALARIDAEHVVAGFADGSLQIVSAQRAEGRLSAGPAWRPHRGAVYAVAALPQGRIASAGEDDLVWITRACDGACLSSDRHGGFVRSLALVGEELASASYDGAIRVRAL